MRDDQTVIPKGYTFLNKNTLVSEKSKAILTDLLSQAEKRDPDANDMYIYNGNKIISLLCCLLIPFVARLLLVCCPGPRRQHHQHFEQQSQEESLE